MKKNVQLHLLLDKGLFEKLSREAFDNDITISEICRRKLRVNSQLDRIEFMVKKLMKNGKK